MTERTHTSKIVSTTFAGSGDGKDVCSVCGAATPAYGLSVAWCEACVRRIDAADPVSAVAMGLFRATYEGETYRFSAAEHANFGPGWMCLEIDGRLPSGVYDSSRLTDVVAIKPADDMPALYRLRGKGSNVTRITMNASPSAVDPSKVRINVAYRENEKDPSQ